MRKRNPKGKRKTTCSKCQKPIEKERYDGGQRYCRSCHAENMRRTRPKHYQLKETQRLMANTRSYLNTYVTRGSIVKQPCVVCGDQKSQAHHEDYLKPLEVIW